MKAVILGAGGQLASDLVGVIDDWDWVLLSHEDLDICDHTGVRNAISADRPDVVINTAAFHRVDDCERKIEFAFEVNTFAVRNLAEVCSETECTLVHISTDYVFSGEKREPYTEDDIPNPLSVYGISKLAGEQFIRNLCSKHFVVRTSGLYGVAGSSGKGGNFVETMIRLAHKESPIRVVNDQVTAPTYTKDLAGTLRGLVESTSYGLYHITSGGECSWYEFAKEAINISGLNADIEPITTQEFGAKATRPAYSVLANNKLKECDVPTMRSWNEALKEYFRDRDKTSVW